MKKLALMLLAFVLMSTQCDDDGEFIPQDVRLEADWNMTQYSFFGPAPPNIERGDVIWNFDTGVGLLTIINTIEDDFPVLPDSGQYAFEIVDDVLIISGLQQQTYRYNFRDSENVLELNFVDNPDISDDELFIRFEK